MNVCRGWIALGVAAVWLGCCAAPAWALIPPTVVIPAASDGSPPVVVPAPDPGKSSNPSNPSDPGLPTTDPPGANGPPSGRATPEPSSLLCGVVGAAGFGLAALRRRSRRRGP
jgi:hypothetical protein